jgi:hypothetical protein
VLIKFGRADDAYFRYGLKTATGPTYLAIFRDTVKRYPDRDRRQVLLDLIEMRGERGKWFAAVKDAGFLDVALLCARNYAAEPATLVRRRSLNVGGAGCADRAASRRTGSGRAPDPVAMQGAWHSVAVRPARAPEAREGRTAW